MQESTALQKLLRFLLGAVIFGVFLMVSIWLVKTKPEPPIGVPPVAQKAVKTTTIELQNYPIRTYVTGRVQAKQSIELFAEVSGKLAIGGKEFREGTKFKKGEAILRLDPNEQLQSVKSQRSAFIQLVSGILADIQIDYPENAGAWMSYVSDLNPDRALPTIPQPKSNQEKLFLTNRGVYNQYYNIQSAEERLGKFTIRAPFDGIVTEALVNPGALVRAGQKMGGYISIGTFEIEAAIEDEEKAFIQLGDSVSFPNQEDVIGVVLRMGESLDPSTQTHKVFIGVDSKSLTSGDYLEGVITSETKVRSTRMEAGLFNPDGSVYAVAKDSTLNKVFPKILHKNKKEILVNGLEEGLVVLSEPVANAFDGMRVIPNKK